MAVNWVVHEQHTDITRTLLADAADRRHLVIAPVHFPGEVTNTIYERWRSADPERHLPEEFADATLARFLAIEVEQLNPPRLHELAYRFAKAVRISSVYDGLYVVLAQQ